MKDHLVRAISRDGTLRAMAAVTTDLVEEVRRRQQTDPTATVAIGRLATGAALMGSLLKGEQRLALTVEGNGPLIRMNAETDAAGHVRATVKNPMSGIPVTAAGFDVVQAVGKAGFLHVTKDLRMREPYRSTVQLATSEIASDLAYYLTTSEQLPSSVALGVFLETDGRVGAAGGFMVQVIPPGSDENIALIEERLRTFPAPTELVRDGLGAAQILERLFAGIPLDVKEETGLAFRCSCNYRQVYRMLSGLGAAELAEILLKEGGKVEVTCEFCGQQYRFSRDDLEPLLKG